MPGQTTKSMAIVLIAGHILLTASFALAQTTQPPNLTITKPNASALEIPIFDKWTDGATMALGDVGNDNVAEVILGSGPGSAPRIKVLRQDGSTITEFPAFDETLRAGVIVGVTDADLDGQNDIVAATGPTFGKYVRVFSGSGELLHDWYPIPKAFADSKISSIAPGNSSWPSSEVTFTTPHPHFENPIALADKQIIVDLSEQRVYAYQDGLLYHTTLASTGKRSTPTPTGTFSILAKVPLKRYSGTSSGHYYNYPNVHWNLLFDKRGYFFHEAYWHNLFGTERSKGCVNLRLEDAKILYDWADIGTTVTVQQ
jgi:hypothetical protein